eukprot:TRINITY_DN5761_c0_g1_i1.p1 TRINITY_DN5761_c0_g1~~TRINITY_DN5761_c0_g1_i1.p1  ORF type:complete len:238 (-),score=74.44 TRINITY_DN5761_c0_g1_i1:47-760(-)
MSSKQDFVENFQRRRFDAEEYEKKAQDKKADENKKQSKEIVVRAALKRRDYELELESRVGKYTVISNNTPLSQRGGYFCDVCDCLLKDSNTYLDHINGKKHQRALGMSMRAERSSLSQVKDKIEEIKRKREETKTSDDVESRLAAYEEEERAKKMARKEKKKKKKGKELVLTDAEGNPIELPDDAGKPDEADEPSTLIKEATSKAATGEEKSEEELRAEMAATLGIDFSGFGGGKKR